MSVVTKQAPTTPDVYAPRLLHIGWQGIDGIWYGLCGHTKTNARDHGTKVPPGYVLCTTCEFEAIEQGWWPS